MTEEAQKYAADSLEQIKNKMVDGVNAAWKESNTVRPFEKLSICVIYCEQDKKNVAELLQQIPKGAELVLCYTSQNLLEGKKAKGIHSYQSKKLDNGIDLTTLNYEYDNWSFADARNACKSFAKREWILFLDADERVAWYPDDWLLNYPNDVGGVMLWCFSHLKENQKECEPVLRLFRNRKEFQYQYRVHEQIAPSIIRHGYRLIHSGIVINHKGYAVETSKLIEKHRRNLILNMMDFFEYGELPRIYRLLHNDINALANYGFIPTREQLFIT